MHRRVAVRFVAALALAASTDAVAQLQPQAPPSGNRITARDGDIILVENDASIRIVRRRDAIVRALFDRTERWIVLLADHAGAGGPDGRVDATYTYRSVSGDWPLEERWEGPATIEEYSAAGENGFGELGFWTPAGLMQILSERNSNRFRDPAAIAVMGFHGSGRSMGNGVSFDESERREVDQLRRNTAGQASTQGNAPSGFVSSISLSATGPGSEVSNSNTASVPYPTPGARVRAGSVLITPVKLVDVPPVIPADAIRAGVRGHVVLEVLIDTDGTVKSTRVLRSIPLLDRAAIEAVRQWRYEPVLLNGQAVPVIVVVTVPFQ